MNSEMEISSARALPEVLVEVGKGQILFRRDILLKLKKKCTNRDIAFVCFV